MYIFAWILFGLFIVSFTFRTSVVIGKCIAINDDRNVTVNINIYRVLLLDIPTFVFICIYLFVR